MDKDKPVAETWVANPLIAPGVLEVEEPNLLVLTAQTDKTCFRFTGDNDLIFESPVLAAGQALLIATNRVSLRVNQGSVDYWVLGTKVLCKLLAFIDEVKTPDPSPIQTFVAIDFEPARPSDTRALEYWFIKRIMQGGDAFNSFQGFLRRLEGYWLVKYLVAESVHLKNVADLGCEYGLSYSHFRRMCKDALGNSLKSELKLWRAARSMLDVIDGRLTMTEVAIKNGYASSSHFSSEVKSLFGMSPRSILDIDV